MAKSPSNPKPYERTVGLILSGGEARRLGGARKPELRLAGVTLIRHATRIMKPQCLRLFAATGIHTVSAFSWPDDLETLPDPGTGPAAALLASASRIAEIVPHSDLLLLAPVDAPFAPTDFAERAASLMGDDTNAVIGRFGSDLYPTHALWRNAELLRLANAIPDPANLSLFALLDQTKWSALDCTAEVGGNPFSNINTPADLVASGRRMQLLNPPSFS